METTLITTLLLLVVYYTYQVIRTNKVYQIREKWEDDFDLRSYKYTFRFMADPNAHNWYGIKFPNEEDYPL